LKRSKFEDWDLLSLQNEDYGPVAEVANAIKKNDALFPNVIEHSVALARMRIWFQS